MDLTRCDAAQILRFRECPTQRVDQLEVFGVQPGRPFDVPGDQRMQPLALRRPETLGLIIRAAQAFWNLLPQREDQAIAVPHDELALAVAPVYGALEDLHPSGVQVPASASNPETRR